MLNDFDPKERKAIIIFFALLLLGVVYVSTHELSWDNPQSDAFNTEPNEPRKQSYDGFL